MPKMVITHSVVAPLPSTSTTVSHVKSPGPGSSNNAIIVWRSAASSVRSSAWLRSPMAQRTANRPPSRLTVATPSNLP